MYRTYLTKLKGRTLTVVFLALALLGMVPKPEAQQPQSFTPTSLPPGFTQQIFGTAPVTDSLIMTGVAFVPTIGDVWVSECTVELSSGAPLFRFLLASTLPPIHSTPFIHPQALGSPFPSNAGCGLTNHPDGNLYSNTLSGVVRLNAYTGQTIGKPFGPPGNTLGITVDPQTQNLVYPASDCLGNIPTTCTIVSVNPSTGASTNFAVLQCNTKVCDVGLVDGIAFNLDPPPLGGNFLFLAVRIPHMRLTILNRSGAIVQHIAMGVEADGIAFHSMIPATPVTPAIPPFVVTNNNEGSITRLDFPNNDYTQVPTLSLFASGGFRGDLSQVGADTCLYVTQNHTRFDDGTVTAHNSVVRICPGFVPPCLGCPTPPGACPLGVDFWEDHLPALSLILGSQSYTQAEQKSILETSFTLDASVILAQQLIAATLNIANGSDPGPISAIFTQANNLLAAFPGKLPYGVSLSSPTGEAMITDASILANYNNGGLTSCCFHSKQIASGGSKSAGACLACEAEERP